MGFVDEESAIRTRFNSTFPGLQPTVEIAWDGVDYSPVSGTPYVEFHLLTGEGRQKEMKPQPLKRYVGIIQLSIYVPAGDGRQPAARIADSCAQVFDLQELSFGTSGRIRCKTSYTNKPTKSKEGWYILIVSCPYERDGL